MRRSRSAHRAALPAGPPAPGRWQETSRGAVEGLRCLASEDNGPTADRERRASRCELNRFAVDGESGRYWLVPSV